MNKKEIFGKKWISDVNKLTIPEIEKLTGVKYINQAMRTKKEYIAFVRLNLLVEYFNKNYPVGSVILWRSVSVETYPYTEMKVKQPAFLSNNQAVVFLQERPGFVSIEPEFVNY